MNTDQPHIRIDPAQRFGQPNVRGISCDMIAGLVWAERSVDAAVDDYDLCGMTRPDVFVACWYVALYGGKRWRKRGWRDWANQHASAFAGRRYDAIPDPPGAAS